MNRYSFSKIYGGYGEELWVWVTWCFLIFFVIATGFYLMGFMNGKQEERSFYLPLVKGMILQIDDKCTSSPWTKRTPKIELKEK